MVKFLVNHPISVLMAFLGCCIVGLVTLFNIPVSLLPDIPIPEITVQVSGGNASARELENTVVAHLRQQLMQLGKLRDLTSETRDGQALLRLSFEYGTNTDLAFVEVNEKIDAAMNYLPDAAERPRVVKSSATDIPVLYLNLTLRSDQAFEPTRVDKFLELSDFADAVVRRRLEQLPEVSMVDVSGMMKRQVAIVPDEALLAVSGITLSEIEQALNRNNVEPGSMVVRDGHYEYNIRFSSVIRTLEDVRSIYFRKNDRIYQLADVAAIDFVPEKEIGMALYRGKRCVKMAVIKQADENMDAMQQALDGVVADLETNYPDIEFQATENQTELLDYTISNLQQNLILAFLFVWLISVLFMKDMRSPVIIGISMVVSVVISLLMFYLLGLSINVVSLTGLILASGNMIDNSIVVTDNIAQYKRRGLSTEAACVTGTSEVITPMLSSMLSSISVFVPLIFLSGIAGALFFDQALSVTLGLLVSYLTGIMLLPVLFKVFSGLRVDKYGWLKRLLKPRAADQSRDGDEAAPWLERLYHRGIEWVFDHKVLTTVVMLLVLPLCALLFVVIPKEKMPDLHQKELVATIDWNEPIHVNENLERTQGLMKAVSGEVEEQTALVGQQQFILNKEREKTSAEGSVYLKVSDEKDLPALQTSVKDHLKAYYPRALVTFAPAGTLFEKVFTTGEAELVVAAYPANTAVQPTPAAIRKLGDQLAEQTGVRPVGVAFQRQLNLHIDQEKLLYHNVSYDLVNYTLRTAFKENQFATLRSYQAYMPVVMGGEEKTVQDVLHKTLIPVGLSGDGSSLQLTLDRFVSVSQGEDVKTLVAGKAGEYVPMMYERLDDPKAVIEAVAQLDSNNDDWDLVCQGGFFANRKMITELMVILMISLLLMYFILVAQFEHFGQPLIILMEIPIDIAASMALLLAVGHTLNLMSAIGMVVTCGIVINDSILKVDVMNQLRKEGYGLMAAIHEAGRRRLKAILMTSFTSIVCMAPLLFSNDLGSNLEKPLALATIGGMLVGTPVSLFVVPLLYWWIYRKHDTAPTPDFIPATPAVNA